MPDDKISLDLVPEIKESLSEARRTYSVGSESMEDRFVEIRPGLLNQLMSRSHHVIQGRRGTGKSTVLNVLLHRAQAKGIPVAVIDMEKHKHRNYPDVLVEIVIDILERLAPRPSSTKPFRTFLLRRKVNREVARLRIILADPDRLSSSITRRSRLSLSGKGTLHVDAGKTRSRVDAAAGRESERQEAGSVETLKIDRLRGLAPEISRLLLELVAKTPTSRSLVIVDDYYFIGTEDQPRVMDYLHSVCKGTGVWLKVCGVGSRLHLYREGDPPIGVQADQDISRLQLDVTLEQFNGAKRFLEQVLNGVIQKHGISVGKLMTPGARNRIVLACGGAVPRDYVNLALDALDVAVDRVTGEGVSSAGFKIATEDINRAARNRISQKEEEDLRQDAADDAPVLRNRWQDVQAFANSRDKTNFILFRQEDLTDTKWGKEVQQLENLRLLHRIGTGVPNTAAWRQIRTVIMMVDLAAIVNKRLSANIIEFWQGQRELDKLRRAQWVYNPDWRSTPEDRGESVRIDLQDGGAQGLW